jgi:hypothetical protein
VPWVASAIPVKVLITGDAGAVARIDRLHQQARHQLGSAAREVARGLGEVGLG